MLAFKTEADKALKEFEQLDIDSFQVRRSKVLLTARQGSIDEAKRMLLEFVNSDKDNPYTHVETARLASQLCRVCDKYIEQENKYVPHRKWIKEICHDLLSTAYLELDYPDVSAIQRSFYFLPMKDDIAFNKLTRKILQEEWFPDQRTTFISLFPYWCGDLTDLPIHIHTH